MKSDELWQRLAIRLQHVNRSDIGKDWRFEMLIESVVRELGAVIVERAAQGDRVTVPGLGLFRAKARKAREVVAPNGGHHHIEEQVVLTFRAAKCVRVLRRGE